MQKTSEWEKSFYALDKRVFSAEAVGAYHFFEQLERFVCKEAFILDFGCGKGDKVIELREKGYTNVYGCDPSELLSSSKSHQYPFIQVMKEEKIPFPYKWDLIFCSGVLHHIHFDHLKNVLEIIYQSLKPSGYFLYIEPRNTWLRRLGHIAVCSRLGRSFSKIRILAQCLDAEWETYSVWLKREKKEFVSICEQLGFSLVEKKDRRLTVLGILVRKS